MRRFSIPLVCLFWALLFSCALAKDGKSAQGATQNMITALARSDAGLAIGDGGGSITLLSPDGQHIRERWVSHNGSIRRLQAHGSQWLSVATDGSVALWDQSGRIQWRQRLEGHVPNDAVLGPKGQLVVGGERGIVARIDSGGPWQIRGEHGRSTFALALDPKAKQVASAGADGRIVVRQLDTGKVQRAWVTGSHWVTALLWTEDGLWSADDEGVVKRWSDQGTKPTLETRPLSGPILRLQQEGKTLFVSAGSGQIKVYHLPGGEPGPTLELKEGGFYPMAADKQRLYFGTPKGEIKTWRPKGENTPRHLWPIIRRGGP